MATIDAFSVMRADTRQVIGAWRRALQAASLRQVRREVQALQKNHICSAFQLTNCHLQGRQLKLKVGWPRRPISLCGGSYCSHSITGAEGRLSIQRRMAEQVLNIICLIIISQVAAGRLQAFVFE